MSMQCVYIDESGEPGSSSRYIVVAAVVTNHDRRLAKNIASIWRAKPQFHHLGELHAHAVDDATRRRVLRTINHSGIVVRYVLVKKNKAQDIDKAYYQAIARLVAEHSSASVYIADQRDTDRKRGTLLRKYGLTQAFAQVEFRSSHTVKQLQAADFVAWALGRHYEHGDKTYVELVDNVQQIV